MFNAGASGSYYYDMTNGQGGFGWNVNAGMGLGGNYAGGFGLNVSYGSGGFSYGLGGSYNPWATKPQVSVYDANIEALKKLWETTRPIRERLAESVPLLTFQTEIKGQNTYYAGNLVGSGREVVAIAFVSGKFYIDKAVKRLDANAHEKSIRRCGRFVGEALQAGSDGNPIADGKDYGPILKKIGFNKIEIENYTARKGDITVYDGNSSHKYGHVQMYNGYEWVSDFFQGYIGIRAGYEYGGAGFMVYSTNIPNTTIYRYGR